MCIYLYASDQSPGLEARSVVRSRYTMAHICSCDVHTKGRSTWRKLFPAHQLHLTPFYIASMLTAPKRTRDPRAHQKGKNYLELQTSQECHDLHACMCLEHTRIHKQSMSRSQDHLLALKVITYLPSTSNYTHAAPTSASAL